jgi:hypothetical protein
MLRILWHFLFLINVNYNYAIFSSISKLTIQQCIRIERIFGYMFCFVFQPTLNLIHVRLTISIDLIIIVIFLKVLLLQWSLANWGP